MYYNGMIFSSKGNKILVNKKGKSKSTDYLNVDRLNLLNYFTVFGTIKTKQSGT